MPDPDDALSTRRGGMPARTGLDGLLGSLRIENLKSLAGAHEVELAPLTLIYGPNAAGKSSLLQSIQLLRRWLGTINRALIEGEEWKRIVSDHGRMVSGHDESLPLTVGIAFASRESNSPPDKLSLTVCRSEHHPLGFQVTLTTSDSTGETTTELESARVPAGSETAYQFHPDLDPGYVTGSSRLEHGTYFLGPHRGDPREPYEHRSAWVTPWPDRPGRLDAEQLNTWLSHLGVPYIVRPISIEEADPDYAEELSAIDRGADWADEEVPLPGDLHHFDLTDTRSGVRVKLEEVGYGVGQLLPILDFCTWDGNQVICIEQPEVHLHPRLQGNLGELFVDSVVRGNQLIVETHSENILLRVQRLVRQKQLAPEQVCVLYVDNTPDEGATVRRLDLDTDGDLLSPWPTGFFDDRLDDILGILE